MRSKAGCRAKKQSKCMKIIRSPIKILSKAKDLYVKSIGDCAGRVGHGGGAVCPYPAASSLPRSFSTVNSFKSSAGDDEEFRQQLLRATSKGGGVGIGSAMGMRSYSVGIGKIGRIDEDKPCSFEEEEVIDAMADLLYPRRRSHAVRRKLVVYR